MYLWKDILKSSAKPIIIKLCFCFLAFDDLIGAKKKFNFYLGEDPTLMSSWEGELVDGLLTAKEENDREKFDKTLKGYTRITPFGKVENAILSHVVDLFDGVGTGQEQLGEELKLDDEGEPDLR